MSDEKEVVRRLEALERTNRRWRIVAVAAVVFAASALLLAAAAAPNIVRARRFDLVDDQGKTRASLRVDAPRQPALETIRGKRGNVLLGDPRPAITIVTHPVVYLRFMDDSGRQKIAIGIDHDGRPDIWQDRN
jgi:hypothetical protein